MVQPLLGADWHRVASLRPRLRAAVRVQRQTWRGRRWYLLCDESSGRQHLVNEAAYRFIGRCDGTYDVQTVWDAVLDDDADAAPTQPEVIELLVQLDESDLLQCDRSPDTDVLFRRHEQRRAQRRRAMINPLSFRLSLGSPSRWLPRLDPLAHALFRPAIFWTWLVTVVLAILAAAANWDELVAHGHALLGSPRALVLAWLCFPVVKALHELGHALAVRRWGGDVPEFGIGLMLLVPAPYVDASAASAFERRGQRAAVAGAGIAVELALAALAALLWVAAQPGTARDIAFVVMTIGGVSTLAFNGDGSATFVYMSDAARAVFGFEPDSSGRPTELAALVAQVHPEDRTSLIEALERSRLALTPLHHEFRVVHHSGSIEWLETRATPERHRDGGTLWHGFTALVTGRKSVELELRRSKDLWDMAAIATGLGIVQLDHDAGRLTLDHRATLMHLLPSSPSSELTLGDWLALIHPDDQAAMAAEVHKARELQEPLVVRYRLKQPGPVHTILELSAHAVAQEHSRVVEIVGTCRDVTGQVSAETLRRDKEAAQHASRSKSEFLSRVSHELRTPLNGILGFAQLMSLDAENPLPPVQRERLQTLQQAGGQLLGLINDMLDVARIEHENFSLECAPVDVTAVARDCVASMAPLAAESGIVLPDVGRQPRMAMAEARSLEQVLSHLLSNAVKYNRPQGHVSLTIATEGRHLQIAVADDGPGLTAEQQKRLFQPFDRLGAERRAIPGRGLGLVIARKLARAMGGDLSVRSGPRTAGTTCTVTLPTAGEVRTRRHVLYIEDEDVNILLMQEVFKLRPDWSLTIARDGADGLRQAAQHGPDLVLADMNLPDMNGIQLVTELRASRATQQLCCIALSADAMREQVDAALRAGFDEYWTKPIDIRRVLRDLSRVVAADRRLLLQPQT